MKPLELPQDWESLLAGYVLGDLTPEDAVKVNQYLQLYPELADEVNSLQATLGLFPLSLPQSSPSDNLRSRILEAAENELSAQMVTNQEAEGKGAGSRGNASLHDAKEEESQFPSEHTPGLSTRRQLRRTKPLWLWLGGGVAAAVVATLGWYNYQLQRQLAIAQSDLSNYRQKAALSDLQKELAQTQNQLSLYQEAVAMLKQPNNRLLALKGTTSGIPSSGSLVIAPNSRSAVLTLQNLAPIPKNKVYRLWAFVNQKKVKCAKFTPDSQGKVMLQIPLKEWGSTTRVFVTIEPKKGLSLPTGKTVMTGTSLI